MDMWDEQMRVLLAICMCIMPPAVGIMDSCMLTMQVLVILAQLNRVTLGAVRSVVEALRRLR